MIAEELRARVASRDVNFGLRADLRRRPEVKPAAIPLTLEACGPGFRGFDDELQVATGRDYGRVLLRKRLHEAGVRTPHVALTPEGTPVYVQWLIGAEDQEDLGRHASPAWAPLAEEQVMVEFAYTFVAHRGKGVMADAMARVLDVGRERGATSALTYVRSDNVPSLRGCAKVGFELDHVRFTTMRAGRRRDQLRPPTESERATWARATAPRGS